MLENRCGLSWGEQIRDNGISGSAGNGEQIRHNRISGSAGNSEQIVDHVVGRAVADSRRRRRWIRCPRSEGQRLVGCRWSDWSKDAADS